MNLYLTDAIGFIKPGQAFIKGENEAEAIQKITEFVELYPQYRIFKTKMISGQESDEVDFDITLQHLLRSTDVMKLDGCPDIYIYDGGGLNEDAPIGNGVEAN